MSPAWIRTRENRAAKSFQVLYRRGGRGFPIESAGTFRTLRDAKLRRDLVGGWLAQGLNPKVELARLLAEPERAVTFETWAERFLASRVDLDDKSIVAMRAHLLRFNRKFAGTDPHTHTPADWQEWIADNSDLKPSSLSAYMSTGRQVMDFAEVTPNPARDRRVKLPAQDEEEPQPPTGAHYLAILDKLPPRWRLPAVTLEQTAMAVGELAALEWGDVDEQGNQFRLRRATVKRQIRARARWVQVPAWLMVLIGETCPLEDRVADRRVFQGFSEAGLRRAMTAACKTARVPHYHPHDLRHRRISLWHGQGVPPKDLAARAGHTKASMSLDVYSHIMPLDEPSVETLAALLVERP